MSAFDSMNFDDIVRYGIAVVVILSCLIAILYVVWGGFLMIVSGGNEEKVKKAVNHIRHALIGIAFLIIVLFVFPFISDLLGFSYGDYAKPAQVFATIRDISDYLFGVPVGTVPSHENLDTALPSDFSQLP